MFVGAPSIYRQVSINKLVCFIFHSASDERRTILSYGSNRGTVPGNGNRLYAPISLQNDSLVQSNLNVVANKTRLLYEAIYVHAQKGRARDIVRLTLGNYRYACEPELKFYVRSQLVIG